MQTRRGFFAALAGLFAAPAVVKAIPESKIVETFTPLHLKYINAAEELNRMDLLWGFSRIQPQWTRSIVDDMRLTKTERVFDPGRLPA